LGSIDADVAANGIFAAAQLSLPVPLADDDGRLDSRRFVRTLKVAPQGRTNAQEAKGVRGDRENPLFVAGRIALVENDGLPAEECHVLERTRLLAPLLEVNVRDAAARGGILLRKVEQTVVLLNQRITAKHHRIQHAEGGHIQTQGQRQHEDRGRGKRALADQRSHRKAEVIDECFEPDDAARFAMCLFRSLDRAELQPGHAAGFGWRHAGSYVVLRGELDVRANFIVKFKVQLLAPKKRAHAIPGSHRFPDSCSSTT
jgi:hypothetical protein